MRHDNDVMRRGIRAQISNLVRAHLHQPRRAAALGLAAAVGTGALLLTAGPNATAAPAPATATAAAVTQTLTRADDTTATRAFDRAGRLVIQTTGTSTAAGKHTAAKPAAANTTGKTAGKGKAAATPTTKAAQQRAAAAKIAAMTTAKPVAGLDKTQMRNAALIVKTGQDLGISQRGQIVAVATAMQESNLYNRASNVVPESLKYDHQGMGSDYDSVGLFQQRYTTGWGTVKSIMDPSQSASKFYKALKQVDGWENMPITVAAQTVQGSAFPDAYAKHQGNATAVVKALNNAAKR